MWDRLHGELIDIVEWTDSSSSTIVHRYQRHGNEIKNGAQLVVRESQVAVFVDQGKLADVFEPGKHELKTSNLPLLSTLRGWKYGFESPFKAEVYFVNTRRFTNQKWGTKNPIMMRDPEFGAIRVRAFGTYVFKIEDPVHFLREIVGTKGVFSTSEISHQLRSMIISRFTDALGESNLSALDMAANYDEIGNFVKSKIEQEFQQYGIQITQFLIENIALPTEVERALDKSTSIELIGDVDLYKQYQTAESIEKAADNPQSSTSKGLELGMGLAMANQIANSMQQQNVEDSKEDTNEPPPIPKSLSVYLAIDGESTGPYSESELREKIEDGSLDRSTLAWTQGMDEWKPAGNIDRLAPLFKQKPPPLPNK